MQAFVGRAGDGLQIPVFEADFLGAKATDSVEQQCAVLLNAEFAQTIDVVQAARGRLVMDGKHMGYA